MHVDYISLEMPGLINCRCKEWRAKTTAWGYRPVNVNVHIYLPPDAGQEWEVPMHTQRTCLPASSASCVPV